MSEQSHSLVVMPIAFEDRRVGRLKVSQNRPGSIHLYAPFSAIGQQ